MAGLLDPQPSGGGLLDFISNDPGSRLGISLLAAGSPKYGRGLLQAFQAQDQMKQQALQNQLLQSQVAENSAQAKMREQQFQLAQQKQNMLSGIFGGGAPLAGVTTGGGLNVPSGGGAPGGIENLTLSQVAALKANGIDVADLWKFGKEGIKRDAGAYYRDVNGGEQFYPQLDRGMAISNGQVVQAPGYAQANAAIKGSEAGAVEAAKYPFAVGQDAARQNLGARLDPTKVYNPQTGREEFVPRAVVAQPQYSGPGYAGGSAANAAQGQLQVMQSEYNRLPEGHPDRPAIMREMQRLGGGQAAPQSGNFAAGPSAAEAAANKAAETRAVNTAAADVVRDTATQKKEKSAGEMIAATRRARELLQQGPTGSGAGELADKTAAFFGRSTKGGEVAAKLDIVAGDLVNNVPRMEGPQSDGDRLEYKLQAGRAADRTLPAAIRLSAMDEVERLQSKYAKYNGGLENAGGATGSWGEPSKGGFRIIGVQ